MAKVAASDPVGPAASEPGVLGTTVSGTPRGSGSSEEAGQLPAHRLPASPVFRRATPGWCRRPVASPLPHPAGGSPAALTDRPVLGGSCRHAWVHPPRRDGAAGGGGDQRPVQHRTMLNLFPHIATQDIMRTTCSGSERDSLTNPPARPAAGPALGSAPAGRDWSGVGVGSSLRHGGWILAGSVAWVGVRSGGLASGLCGWGGAGG